MLWYIRVSHYAHAVNAEGGQKKWYKATIIQRKMETKLVNNQENRWKGGKLLHRNKSTHMSRESRGPIWRRLAATFGSTPRHMASHSGAAHRPHRHAPPIKPL